MCTTCPAAGMVAASRPGVGLCTLWRARGLDHVDVVVDGAGVVRIRLEHAFQRRNDLSGSPFRSCSARLPIIPRAQVHQRLGVQHGDHLIFRVPAGHLLHRLGVGCVEGGALRRWVVGIPHRERFNQYLFARCDSILQFRCIPLAASAAGTAAASIGALMFGPSASASPQKHMAQVGSSRCALRNARRASAWLNARDRRSP